MTKTEFFALLREWGYADPGFLNELEEDETGTVSRLIKLFKAGKDRQAWLEIKNLYDEFTFFSVFSDDDIICGKA